MGPHPAVSRHLLSLLSTPEAPKEETVKHPPLVTLELGIRALEHEALAYCALPTSVWDSGVQEGLERAIKILQNLNIANQQLRKDPRP